MSKLKRFGLIGILFVIWVSCIYMARYTVEVDLSAASNIRWTPYTYILIAVGIVCYALMLIIFFRRKNECIR